MISASPSLRQVFDEHGGILRLVPVFVPRRFNQPGHRLRLHPDDYYALGTARGAIKERWFASTIVAIHGLWCIPCASKLSTFFAPSRAKLLRPVTRQKRSKMCASPASISGCGDTPDESKQAQGV